MEGESFDDFLKRTRSEKKGLRSLPASSAHNGRDVVDSTTAYDTLTKDLIGNDSGSEDDEDDYGKSKKGRKPHRLDEEAEKVVEYMFFDFRKGAEGFPANCEIIDPARAEALLEKQTVAAEEALKLKKSDNKDEEEAGNKSTGTGTTSKSTSSGASTWVTSADDDVGEYDANAQISEAIFEVLQDGSTALVMKPGYRLKLKLNELNEGGDAAKEEREKKAKKKKKKSSKSGK